jgi:hypothetical protein
MPGHVTRRPLPVEQSILWKPLRDSHYVVASLQPADGGRRKIFVRQQVLRRVEVLVEAQGRRAFGLLLGRFYQCPVTGSDYLVIESVAEQSPVDDETEIAAAVAKTLAERPTDKRADVLGWYRCAPAVEPKPSLSTAAVHTSLFRQPWQTTLVVGDGNHTPSGAFFLHDTVNSRWFYAPFYELAEHLPAADQPKPTLVSWPQYTTVDNTAPVAREPTSAAELADVRPKRRFEWPGIWRAPGNENGGHLRRSLGIADVPPVASSPDRVAPTWAPTPTRQSVEPTITDAPPLTDRPATRRVHSFAAAPKPDREIPITRLADESVDQLSTIDDRDQIKAVPSNGRRVRDDDDTTMGDAPGRYIDLARSEGFFIAGRFDTRSESSSAETLWILNEPYSGLLLAVVTTDTEIVDATLHYNLQTDDAGLLRVPFPEHRDPESKTIYVRETCVDSLRARCHRLRATNALLKEWKVTPRISLLTPGEWESVPMGDARMDRGGDAINDINKARIAELPEGVRSQFHIGTAGENNA